MSWQVKNEYDGCTEVIANVDGETFADGTISYSYDFICSTALDEFGDDSVDRSLAASRARLISAAPEMLDALKQAMETLKAFDPGDPATETGWKHDELCDAWVSCRAAIAKATGEAS